jgi:hypothetical protein
MTCFVFDWLLSVSGEVCGKSEVHKMSVLRVILVENE